MSALAELLDGPVEEVAPRLLGAVLRHGPVAVRLTEVEAYAGPADPGSHSFRGPTPRNQVMWGPPGFLYCYLSHGIHVCANVSVGPEGTASAVLMRAGEVVDGLEVARAHRPGVIDRDLARGPGRLCKALGIRLDHYGTDLTDGEVTLTPGEPPPEVASGPRTGLRLAAGRPWRFWAVGDPTVSPYRRHPRAEGD
ncbi:DNA-3-methyladenine glycosylase [Nocardioides silvaticus]|uniref:Putative 3-methyladenine DNA glycosylase n=1 Tax=Nocardioides silvaticus TaxID=2201891 RepID=A0A316TG24_9ACTN|nr:DNA-3-methyladenine glycosylase [Nocardioides silvaticus]PWN02738.1 DNA-3-methyladenine glycosylase [Nocardioides silvaticus]